MTEGDIKNLEERLEVIRSAPGEGVKGIEKVDVLIELAHRHYSSNPQKTEDYASQALALAEKQDYKNGIAESSRIIGITFALKGDYEKALESYHRALEIFEEAGDKEGIANCSNNIGLVHKNRGDYEKALEYQRKALLNFEGIGDRSGVAYSYKNIGLIHDKRGSYDKALEHYLGALKIFEDDGDKKGIAVCSSSIGVVYKKQAEYGQALEYYHKALEVFTEIGNKQFMAHTYNNIGIIYKNQNDYDQALEYCNKALKMFTEIGDKRGIANSYGNLGIIHGKRGSYDHSLEYYVNALKIFEEIGDKLSVAISYGNIGQVHTQLKRYDSALDNLQKCLELTQKIGAKDWEMHSYGYLSELYEAQGDFVASLSYYKKYSELKETIFSEESAEKTAQMKTRYEIEKKEREAEIYRLRNVELEAEITERKQAEKREKEYLKDLKFLYDSALDFLDLVPDRDIYRYIGNKIHELVGSGLVAVASYDETTGKFTGRRIVGVGGKTDAALKLFGRNPVGFQFTIPPVSEAQLLQGKLRKVPTILDKITDTKIPARSEEKLKKLVGLGDIYTMGLARRERLFGFVLIIMNKGTELLNKDVVETFVNQASIVLLRSQVEKELAASLAEKEALLKEVHHRVKNNLQVISSLLNLQAGYVEDERILNMLANSQSRIESMALIHEKLYQSEDLARINLGDYLRNLARSLFVSYKVAPSAVALQINIGDILLGIDKAIPLALIINELISNSLVHAFPGERKGGIRVDLCEDGDKLVLTVADNGVGLPKNFDFQTTKSLGLRLVSMLVGQLKGSLELTRRKGTKFKITLPIKKPKPKSDGLR